MTLYIDDPDFVLHVGDALEMLQAMPAESVHCCVTSPPESAGLAEEAADRG